MIKINDESREMIMNISMLSTLWVVGSDQGSRRGHQYNRNV